MNLCNTMQASGVLLFGLLIGGSPHTGLVQAQEAQTTLLVEADLISEFGQLIDESEARLGQKIRQAFSADPTIQQLQITIMASRGGAIVPLMTTTMSRSDWQRTNRFDAWTQYFSNAEVLLSYQSAEITTDVTPEPEPSIQNEFPTTQERIELIDELD